MNHTIRIERTRHSRLDSVDFNDLPFGKVFSDHMFVADFSGGTWKNPRVVPFGPFSTHPATMALHYGQSIFEGMKASKSVDGQPLFFRPEMHAKRLNLSAARMCMPEVPETLFMEALHTLVDLDQAWIPASPESALYIRPFMFATDEFIGVKPSEAYKFIIFTGPVGPYYAKPVRLWVEQEYVRAIPGGTGEAKAAGNYAGSLLPAKIAQSRGFDQVMWMDGYEFKYVQEVGTMNIFFVIDGVAVTPATDGAILKGITRDSILHILRDKKIPVEERPVSIDELVAAHKSGKLQEAFGVGTAAVVSHVAEIAYNAEIMTLPSIETRKIGALIKSEIEGLKSGVVRDHRGWIVPVKTPVLVEES